ncbi:23S rRNA (pseudouridine(1915)-N(3))-methyltransferase RlmH [uncultured Mesonia sp.]|uniref:23S rRNA (pseudouridine(1915)-N(3))-methyltransferase RlmH n=1 Tax=uncultured Mesonia sp. TaxID=399731 RepID=UPI00374F9E57
MKIKLIVVGKTDKGPLQDLIADYCKRLTHYIPFELQVIPDLKKTKHLDVQQQKQKEGELILKEINTSDWLVLLDEAGKSFTSMQFAQELQKKLNAGTKQLVFVIGGPYGFSDAVYQQAKQKISLSKMTFSHQMVRLFFVEQIYRGFTILKNEPYHHQ